MIPLAAKSLPVQQERVNFNDGVQCQFIVPVRDDQKEDMSTAQLDAYVISKAMHGITKFLIEEDLLECDKEYDMIRREERHSFRIWVTKPSHMRERNDTITFAVPS